MDDALKFGSYLVLLLPGFIFNHVLDYHLMQEKDSQFIKTFKVVLFSLAIWMAAFASPIVCPLPGTREELFAALASMQVAPNLGGTKADYERFVLFAKFFTSACLWSFIMANIIGATRKDSAINSVIAWITGRDWYSSNARKFFRANISKPVIVTSDGERYLGVLNSAPELDEDNHIILTNVYRLPDPSKKGAKKMERLETTDYMLFKYDKMNQIQALAKETIITRAVSDQTSKVRKYLFAALKLIIILAGLRLVFFLNWLVFWK